VSRTRHTEAQMIAALKQMEAGRKAEDVAREVGVSKHTIYAWKAKYGGMSVSEAQEAKQLREENTRLAGGPPFQGAPCRMSFPLWVPHPFAICAKGWADLDRFQDPKLNGIGPWFPPLHRTQGWGTLSRGGIGKI